MVGEACPAQRAESRARFSGLGPPTRCSGDTSPQRHVVRLMTTRQPPAILSAKFCVLSVQSWLDHTCRLFGCACTGSDCTRARTGALSLGQVLAGAAITLQDMRGFSLASVAERNRQRQVMVCRVKDRSEFQGLKTAFAPVSLGPHAIDIGASVIRLNAPPRRRFGAMAERRD